MNMNNRKIKWGILGAGNIANKFACGLQHVSNGELYAISSRSSIKADSFAEKFNISKKYNDYLEMLSDDEIDIVYIATSHSLHYKHVLMCLDNNKSVLCEKPFALNSKESLEMIKLAKKKNLFLMEAMWSWFFPAFIELKKLVNSGTIGDIKLIKADMGYIADKATDSFVLNKELGGGALLDIGVYTISFCQMFMEKPIQIESIATLGEAGVDIQSSYLMKYNNGVIASLFTSLVSNTNHSAVIYGSKGRIEIDNFFWKTNEFKLILNNSTDNQIFSYNENVNRYNYEAEHVGCCLLEGKTQSPIYPFEKTMEVMEIMDNIRASWGLIYPAEMMQ